MSLQAIVESLDDVPEALRDQYVENGDGKFKLDVQGVEFPDDVAPLKNALDREKAQRREFAKKLKQFDGVDLEKYNELLEKQREAEEKKLLDEGEVEKLIEKRTLRMREDHEKELQETKQKLTHLESKLRSEVVTSKVNKAAVAANVLDEKSLRLIEMMAANSIKFKDDGTYAIFEGDEEQFGSDGQPLSIEEWMTDLASEYPNLFKDSQGSEARKQTSRSTVTKKPRSQMTVKEKSAFIAEQGQEAFLALPE